MSQVLNLRAAWRWIAIVLSVLSLVSMGIAQVHSATCELGEDCCSGKLSVDCGEQEKEAESATDSDHGTPPHSGCSDNCAAGCCAGPLVFVVLPALSVAFEFTQQVASPTEALASSTSEGSSVSVFRPPRLFA